MAARWRWTSPNRNAGHNVPVGPDTLKAVTQGNLHVDGEGTDMQSCVDQTILAIFEDSALMSEGGNGVDDESEKLLSALTEMLDTVEDDDGNLSPFDTLPDTELLDYQTTGNSDRLSHSDRPGPTTTRNGTVKTETDGDKKGSKKSKRSPPCLLEQQQGLFCSKTSRAEAEVEVFNSTSLSNLVKIMHPYCLKLHVEEEGERLRRHRAFFSQEQVWKYERPKEGSDEEINVVSDDDDKRPDEKKFFRSVLQNEKSPRKRKRVSFGAVQVSLFEEAGLCEQKERNTGEAPSDGAETATGAMQEAQYVTGGTTEVVPLKRAKSLSLQQYRQRQHARVTLVEQSGNYTAKWPSVSGTPQELTPILSLPGPNRCGPNTRDTGHRNIPATVAPEPESKLSACLDHSKIKRSRAESCMSSHHLLSAPAVNPDVATKRMRSPQKRPLASSDPPNPVVLPLPVHHTSPLSERSLDSSSWNQAESSGTSVQLQDSSSGPKVDLLSENQDWSQRQLAQTASGAACKHSVMDPDTRPMEPSEHLPSLKSPCVSSHTSAAEAEEEQQTEVDRKWTSAEASAAPGSEQMLRSTLAASGIEASDLTSLLEQFEETQVKEKGAQPSMEVAEASGAAYSAGLPDTLRTSCHAQPSQAGLVPTPLGSDVIIDMQTQLLTSKRPKNPSSKAVQMIEPRPLPRRKTHGHLGHLSGVSAVLICHVSSDHDYCRPHVPPPGTATSLRDVCADPRHVSPDPGHGASTWILSASDSSRTSDSPETHLPGRTEPGSHTPVLSAPSGSEETTGLWPLPTPPSSAPSRGRNRRRCQRRANSGSSSCSSSSSSSSSPCSTKRHRCKRSGSSSSSPSPSSSRSPQRRYSWSRSTRRGSRSRSTSWSRSRSPAPRMYSSREGHSNRTRRRTDRESRKQKLKAIDERRVVYVGRICGSMTPDELRERFLQFGQVECVSLHFRETGDHYGFVTFYNVTDAFAAIDNGSKLRRPDEKPFDLCFGGRRQFCPSDYTDLDADREMEGSPARSNFVDLDFDQLLKQAQGGRNRPS